MIDDSPVIYEAQEPIIPIDPRKRRMMSVLQMGGARPSAIPDETAANDVPIFPGVVENIEWSDVLFASLRQNNVVGKFLTSPSHRAQRIDPNFKIEEAFDRYAVPKEDWHLYERYNVVNEERFREVYNAIAQERADEYLLSQVDIIPRLGNDIAAMMTDPVNIINNIAAGAITASVGVLTGGTSASLSPIIHIASFTALNAAERKLLSFEKTWESVAEEVGLATVTAGAIKGGGALLKTKPGQAVVDAVQTAVSKVGKPVKEVIGDVGRFVSDAVLATVKGKPSEQTVKEGLSIFRDDLWAQLHNKNPDAIDSSAFPAWYKRIFSMCTPLGRLATSDSPTANTFAKMFLRSNYETYGMRQAAEASANENVVAGEILKTKQITMSAEALLETLKGQRTATLLKVSDHSVLYSKQGGTREAFDQELTSAINRYFDESIQGNVITDAYVDMKTGKMHTTSVPDTTHAEVDKAAKLITKLLDQDLELTHQSGKLPNTNANLQQFWTKKIKEINGEEKEITLLSTYVTAKEAQMSVAELNEMLAGGQRGIITERTFGRVWDRQAVIERKDELIELLKKLYVKQKSDDRINRYCIQNKCNYWQVPEDIWAGRPINEKNIQAGAEKIYEELIGHIDNHKYLVGIDMPGRINMGGRVEKRIVRIADSVLYDFLERDPARRLTAYEVACQRDFCAQLALKNMGFKDIKEVISKIESESTEAIAKVTGKNNEEIISNQNRVRKHYDQAAKDARAIYDIMMGTYGRSDNPTVEWSIRLLRGLSYVTNLGHVVLSSLDNIAHMTLAYDAERTVGPLLRRFGDDIKIWLEGWKPYTEYEKGLTHLDRVRARKLQLMAFGSGIELETGRLSASLDNLGNIWTAPVRPRGFNEQIDTSLEQTSRWFSKWTGSAYWEDSCHHIIGQVFEDETLAKCSKGWKNLSVADREELLKYRINENLCDRIGRQFSIYGDTWEGARISNAHKWEDLEAARAFGAANVNATNNIVTLPGMGDVPLSFRTTWGRVLFSYKSFLFAFQNNMMRTFATSPGGKKAAYVFTLIAMTAAGEYLKSLSKGNPYSIDYDFFEDIMLRLPLGGVPVDIAQSSYRVMRGMYQYGLGGGNNEMGRAVPNLNTALRYLNVLMSGLRVVNGRVLSEKDLSDIMSTTVIADMPGISALSRKWRRQHVLKSGGKIQLTRAERKMFGE